MVGDFFRRGPPAARGAVFGGSDESRGDGPAAERGRRRMMNRTLTRRA